MSRHFYRGLPALAYDPAVVPLAPNNVVFSVSDHAGTFVKTASRIRLTRATEDGQGLEHAAPGARVRFAVHLIEPGIVEIDLEWTGLITREEIYNASGEVWVNGANAAAFVGPSKGPTDPHPTGGSIITLPLSAGLKTIEIIFPYCASMDFRGARIPGSAIPQPATPRPSIRGVWFGDSLTAGHDASRVTTSRVFKVAHALGVQQLNHGYSGRPIAVEDATTAGSFGCDFGVRLIGTNDYLENGRDLTAFKNAVKIDIANFRAASTAAAKPAAPLHYMTLTWLGSDDGIGPYVGNNPTPEEFREATRDAITEAADPYAFLREGLAPGMPTGAAKFDGPLVHPRDVGQSEWAAVEAGWLA